MRTDDSGGPALQPKSKGTRAQTRNGLPEMEKQQAPHGGLPHPWPGLSLLVPNTCSPPNTGRCHPPGTSSEGLRDQGLSTPT